MKTIPEFTPCWKSKHQEKGKKKNAEKGNPKKMDFDQPFALYAENTNRMKMNEMNKITS